MRIRFAFTYEYETQPPQTYTGIAEGTYLHTCFMRAEREARKALRPSRWSSAVCVALERLDRQQERDSGVDGVAAEQDEGDGGQEGGEQTENVDRGGQSKR